MTNRRTMVRVLVSGLVLCAGLDVLRAQEEQTLLEEREYDETEAERCAEMREHPISLNSSEDGEIYGIPEIPLETLQRIVAWRKAGTVHEYGELLRISGMTEDLLRVLRRYTTLDSDRDNATWQGGLRVRSSLDKRSFESYGSSLYRGQRGDVRARLQYGDPTASAMIRAEMRMEKDAGEERLNDLASGYVRAFVPGLGLSAIAGNFRIGHGLGITFQRTRMTSTPDPGKATAAHTAYSLRHTAPSDLTGVHRGIALQWQRDGHVAEVFMTSTPIHASVDDAGTITSFVAGDYFRTDGEQRKRNATYERGAGIRLATEIMPGWAISVLHARFALGRQVAAEAGMQHHGGTSLSTGYQLDDIRANAEIGWDHLGGCSFGMIGFLNIDERVVASVWLRAYSQRFSVRYGGGSAFWSDRSQNERGMGFDLRCTPEKGMRVLLNVDRAARRGEGNAWAKTTRGINARGSIEIALSPRIDLGIATTIREQDVVAKSADQNSGISEGTDRRASVRVEYEARPTPSLQVKMRCEGVRSVETGKAGNGTGLVLFQELRLRNVAGFSFSGRITCFDIDRYDARGFGVLPDLPGASSLHVFDGKGTQWTIVVRAPVFGRVACSLKYVQNDAIPRYSGTGPLPLRDRWTGLGLQIEHTFSAE